jgi:predicted nucleic acid-binding Zn ribbon protein
MMYFSEERCVMCGEIIPEGRMVCLRCERAASEQHKTSDCRLGKAQRRKVLRFPWLTINRR